MNAQPSIEQRETRYPSGAVHEFYSAYRMDGRGWVRHGEYRSFHENGTPSLEVGYEHGAEVGISREFHPNGQLAAEGCYEWGEKHGPWRFYSADGALEEEVVFNCGAEVG
jgi:antitoxin component YwqK of YwqJK toxin-antitoxin module